MVSFEREFQRTLQALAVACILVLAACAGREAPRNMAAPNPQPLNVAPIWKNGPPGQPATQGEESQEVGDQGWRQITVVKNVTNPTVTVIRPPAGRANGSAMLVLPGGVFMALAWDLEGTEVGQYLAGRGVTAFVLKYRVSDATPEMLQRYLANRTTENLLEVLEPNRARAAEDAMQAVRFVRANAVRFGVDPNRVGMIGFSAGAITTLRVLEEADDASRPNIAASVYGLTPEREAPAHPVPIFLAAARNDETIPASASEEVFAAWRRAGAPAEIHVFETGAHGFGLGRPETESAQFRDVFEAWLRTQGFIESGARN